MKHTKQLTKYMRFSEETPLFLVHYLMEIQSQLLPHHFINCRNAHEQHQIYKHPTFH